jgi:hypothetical protein
MADNYYRHSNLKKEETINVVAELRKKGFIQPTENLEVAPKNSEVAPKIIKQYRGK